MVVSRGGFSRGRWRRPGLNRSCGFMGRVVLGGWGAARKRFPVSTYSVMEGQTDLLVSDVGSSGRVFLGAMGGRGETGGQS